MLQQKQYLIDSMLRLIKHLSLSPLHQLQIYHHLSPSNLSNLISNFNDQNPIVRKTSASLLCHLLYNNNQVKRMFIEDFNIQPGSGNIVLNKIPTDRMGMNSFNEILEVLELIKSVRIQRNDVMCWYWRWGGVGKGELEYVRRAEEFMDPETCLFGFIYQEGIENKKESKIDGALNTNGRIFERKLRAKQQIMNPRSSGDDYLMREADKIEKSREKNILLCSFERNLENNNCYQPSSYKIKTDYSTKQTHHTNSFNSNSNPNTNSNPRNYFNPYSSHTLSHSPNPHSLSFSSPYNPLSSTSYPSHPNSTKNQDHKSINNVKPRQNETHNPNTQKYPISNTTRIPAKSFHQILGYPKPNQSFSNGSIPNCQAKQICFKKK